MRQLIQSIVLSGSMIAMMACSTESPSAAPPPDQTQSPVGLQIATPSLQANGVHYLRTSGTAADPAFTFYDQRQVVIGTASSIGDDHTEIHWRGDDWESNGDAFTKNGAEVVPATADAAERDTVLAVFEASMDQAFPAAASNGQLQPSACPVREPCSRPKHRCEGSCRGFVCSQTDGSPGICINVN